MARPLAPLKAHRVPQNPVQNAVPRTHSEGRVTGIFFFFFASRRATWDEIAPPALAVDAMRFAPSPPSPPPTPPLQQKVFWKISMAFGGQTVS